MLNDFNSINPSTGNAGYTESVAQEWLNRTAIENLEETTLFSKFGKKPVAENGYATTAFWRPTKIDQDEVSDVTTSTSDPDDTNVEFGLISVAPRVFGINNTIRETVGKFNVMDVMAEHGREFGKAMGRKLDTVVQDVLWDYAVANTGRSSKIIKFAGSATSLASFTTSSTGQSLKLTDITKGKRILNKRGARRMGDTYVAVISEEVASAIETDGASSTSITFNDTLKHTPEGIMRIFAGYLGVYSGVSIYENNHVKERAGTGAGTPAVQASYLFGEGAYGTLYYTMNAYYNSPSNITTNNKIGMFGSVGVKSMYNAIVLDEDSYLIYVSKEAELE